MGKTFVLQTHCSKLSYNSLIPYKTIKIVRNDFSLGLISISIFLLLSCAGLQIQERPSSPVVRIGILEHKNSVKIKVSGRFRITDRRNFPIYKGQGSEEWLITTRNFRPGKYRYRICIGKSNNKEKAQNVALHAGLGLTDVEFTERGECLLVRRKVVADSRNYQVLLSRHFSSEQAAEEFKTNHKLYNSKVIKETTDPSSAEIVVSSDSLKKEVVVEETVRISGTTVKLSSVDVGNGFHWAHTEDRTYRGTCELLVDDAGRLTVVNILPLEDYLRGVVPSEMPAKFPLEALKAQAVAARTYYLSRFGQNHNDKPFDVCDEVHCQVYSGLSKEADNSNNAVSATRGLVLSYKDQLCDMPYGGVCGGHTERAENVWNTDGKPYLKGILDFESGSQLSGSLDLTHEDRLRTWIEASPKVFCNTLNPDIPSSFDYTKKYFRWQVCYNQKELKEIIENKTGRQIGSIIDIIPIRRGVSGRMIKVEIKGTRGSFRIEKELAIRKALSPNALYSSCFIIEKRGSQNGLPQEFIFKGAGWGHGVGMCQTGAGVMALKGNTIDKILIHYYPGTKIKKVY